MQYCALSENGAVACMTHGPPAIVLAFASGAVGFLLGMASLLLIQHARRRT